MAAIERTVLVRFKQLRNLLYRHFLSELYPSIYIMGEGVSVAGHVGI
jgi:hypothetical protein